MADVFISYHRSESASTVVRRIAYELENRRISCWYDKKDPDLGHFAQQIEREISHCRVFLFIWDQGSDNSQYCKAEVHSAFSSDNRPILIPFQLGDFKKGDEIAFYIKNQQIFYDIPTLIAKIVNLLQKSAKQPMTSKPTSQQHTTQKLFANNMQKELAIWQSLCFALALIVIILVWALNRPMCSMDKGLMTIYKMGHIGSPWSKDSVTSICISGNITKIRNGAFKDCKNLKKVIISNGVTKIGNESFYGCSNLHSITIPEGVTQIGYGAFYSCHNLPDITIPESVTKIGEKAFAACSNLESVNIPSNATLIPSWAFSGCQKLSKVKMYEGLIYIQEGAFWDCGSLKNIELPESTTYIGGEAFGKCMELSEINIPNGLETIEVRAFVDCTSLDKVEVPIRTTIGKNAFPETTEVIRRP